MGLSGYPLLSYTHTSVFFTALLPQTVSSTHSEGLGSGLTREGEGSSRRLGSRKKDKQLIKVFNRAGGGEGLGQACCRTGWREWAAFSGGQDIPLGNV